MDPKVLMIGAAAAGLVVGFVAGIIVGKSGAKSPSSNRKQSPKKKLSGGGVELYVGTLSYDIDDDMLRDEFAKCGKVVSARVIKNKYNDRSRGYGFVEMASEADAEKAVKMTHAKEIMGRKLVVNIARSSSRD